MSGLGTGCSPGERLPFAISGKSCRLGRFPAQSRCCPVEFLQKIASESCSGQTVPPIMPRLPQLVLAGNRDWHICQGETPLQNKKFADRCCHLLAECVREDAHINPASQSALRRVVVHEELSAFVDRSDAAVCRRMVAGVTGIPSLFRGWRGCF